MTEQIKINGHIVMKDLKKSIKNYICNEYNFIDIDSVSDVLETYIFTIVYTAIDQSNVYNNTKNALQFADAYEDDKETLSNMILEMLTKICNSIGIKVDQ